MNFLSRLVFDLCKIIYTGDNRRAKASGILICIILFFDLHRFGAWYTGNRAHIKTHWIFVMLLVSVPLQLLILKKMLRWYVKVPQRMDHKLNGIYAGIITFFNNILQHLHHAGLLQVELAG